MLELFRKSRARPVVVTPVKGSVGDLVHEEDAAGTSVDSIIRKYGGNLAEWRKTPVPFDCDVNGLSIEEAVEKVSRIGDIASGLELPPGMSLDEALMMIRENDIDNFISRYNEMKKEERKTSNETQENQPPEE